MIELPCEIVMKRRSGEEKAFLLRRCVVEDVDMIEKLQELVFDAVPDKSLFVRTSREEFAESLELDQCFCFMDGDKMAAFTLMVAPRTGYRNYGCYLDYSDEQLMKTATMDTSFVHPDYRGYGLQKYFFEKREAAAKELLGAEQALTAISADNGFSLDNARKSGYTEVKRMVVYNGLERCILKKVF